MFRKKKTQTKTYDKEKQKPILKCSICNGEQVAGLKDLRTGQFEEIMFISDENDLKHFMNMFGIDKVEKEY